MGSGGPFDETQQNWLEAKNWDFSGEGSRSSTPSPTHTEDNVTISQEDGLLFWSELLHGADMSGQDYLKYRRDMRCLLEDIEYYDITEFHDEYYYYCAHKREAREDARENKNDYWWDPDFVKELQWLLARPTGFPVVPSLSSSTSIAFTTTTSLTSQSPCIEVFKISELIDVILDYITGQDISQTELADKLQLNYIFTPLSVIQSTETIFALLQVNKSLYATFLRDRQAIFLRLAWLHGWMLPFTPQDWNNWPNGTFRNGIIFKVDETQDWRSYLLTFLRKEDVHVRNRWKFHKMAVQFARGAKKMIYGTMVCLRPDVGELGFRPDVKPPRPWFWEEGGFEDEDEDEDEEDVCEGDGEDEEGEDGGEDWDSRS
ncbi:hypothetical protein Clacol_009482 [Clathrus columnatus]|uniref:Uncharacterized protein n=1 Tax=Clathrus columnatus TaxID=1419009 RepID=A0AAV5AQP1_9AGAM|nr:hypothetical protein Clacol_009482 [Clathrus columnatus]